MLSTTLVALLATAVTAAPLTERDLNSTKWTPEHVLQPHEVIIFGQGRAEVVHESVYHRLLESEGLSVGRPESTLNGSSAAPEASSDPKLQARQCDFETAVITDREETFVDWDVQMSPVVIGTGSGMDITVSSGFSVSNSVSVSAGLSPTLVKDKLGASFGIDYSRTWTSQTMINFKGTVANGDSGVMITKPIKTRKYGRAMKGCLGSQTEDGTFQADSFKEHDYSGVKWVSGAITMCTKKEFPLTFCTGQGTFV